MKLQISFKQPNPDFDQQMANTYHWGKESEGNLKFSHDESYRAVIDRYDLKRKTDFRLVGETNKGKIDIILKNVAVMKLFIGNDCVEEIVVSEALIKSFLKNQIVKANRLRVYFYLKPDADFKRYGKLIYVLKEITH
jgi:hypothetical protein